MKVEIKVCKSCGKKNPVRNSRGVCVYCVKNNNDKLKKKYPNNIEIKQNYRFKKATGEKGLFEEIWLERDHFCANLNCRKFLGHIPIVHFFSHRKSKGAYPELRLDKTNIDLLCRDCHYEWDFGDKTKIRYE